jgi:hypothetical protein
MEVSFALRLPSSREGAPTVESVNPRAGVEAAEKREIPQSQPGIEATDSADQPVSIPTELSRLPVVLGNIDTMGADKSLAL